MADERHSEGMQRIRIGLTGLAVVLLIVVLATAVFRAVDTQSADNAATPNVDNSDKSKDEPLADLGVAPGAAPENAAAPMEKAP